MPASDHYDLFLAAGLRQPGCMDRNERIVEVAERLGMSVYSPGRDTIREQTLAPVDILLQNRQAIEKADILLFVPDDAGAGVYYELGLADALGKTIVGFSLARVGDWGKIVEGRWALIEPERQATNFEELDLALRALQSVRSENAI